MVMISALVRIVMLQVGAGVAWQIGTASENMTNSALSLMVVALASYSWYEEVDECVSRRVE
jgi:hypothetical protein